MCGDTRASDGNGEEPEAIGGGSGAGPRRLTAEYQRFEQHNRRLTDDAVRRGLLVGKVHPAEVQDHSPAGFIVDVEVEDPASASVPSQPSPSSSPSTPPSSSTGEDDTGKPAQADTKNGTRPHPVRPYTSTLPPPPFNFVIRRLVHVGWREVIKIRGVVKWHKPTIARWPSVEERVNGEPAPPSLSYAVIVGWCVMNCY